MNDLIEKLVEQAGLYQGTAEGDCLVCSAFDYKKFVKLIVQECCDVLHDNEMGGYQVNYVLKEHFGVDNNSTQ